MLICDWLVGNKSLERDLGPNVFLGGMELMAEVVLDFKYISVLMNSRSISTERKLRMP